MGSGASTNGAGGQPEAADSKAAEKPPKLETAQAPTAQAPASAQAKIVEQAPEQIVPEGQSTGSLHGATPGELFKTVHSAIRWKKDNIEELLSNAGSVECLDEKTGNTPIHIAAQNGYVEIVKILVAKKANVNAQNKKGNTALHMAIAYDYFETVKVLLDAGADLNLTNEGGFPACKGLEGDKTLALMAITLATNTEECLPALEECEAKKSEMDKAVFISTCLKKKKSLGALWTADLQKKMGDIVSNW